MLLDGPLVDLSLSITGSSSTCVWAVWLSVSGLVSKVKLVCPWELRVYSSGPGSASCPRKSPLPLNSALHKAVFSRILMLQISFCLRFPYAPFRLRCSLFEACFCGSVYRPFDAAQYLLHIYHCGRYVQASMDL